MLCRIYTLPWAWGDKFSCCVWMFCLLDNAASVCPRIASHADVAGLGWLTCKTSCQRSFRLGRRFGYASKKISVAIVPVSITSSICYSAGQGHLQNSWREQDISGIAMLPDSTSRRTSNEYIMVNRPRASRLGKIRYSCRLRIDRLVLFA